MRSFIPRWLSLAAALVFLGGWSPRLQAQPYPYPYPYPGYSNTGFGPGNVLNGTANVMDAQGNLMLQQEQARVDREKALQAQLDTKRKTLDWQNYEREHTWTYGQDVERNKALRIQRLLQNPAESEVLSGSGMNTLLPYLNQLAQQGVQGAPVPLDPYLLQQINVTGAGKGADLGVLKDAGHMNWPIGLRGPQQKDLDAKIAKAVTDAAAGTLELSQYNQILKETDKLLDKARDSWNAEQMDTGNYLDCKHYLESVRKGLGVLIRPDAQKFINGSYAARGNTVAELVVNMSTQGLKFAAARPGSEPAYFALYNAFLTFAASGESTTGFRVRYAPAVLKTSSADQKSF